MSEERRYSLEDLLISRMARELKGEIVGGAATFCSMAAVKLAQFLHNPDLIDMSGGLHHFDSRAPLTLFHTEFLGKESAKARVSWGELFLMVFREKFFVWIGPAQIDQNGNANISAIGPWDRPKAALVGARGLPDDSVHLTSMNYHVIDHSKRTFVPRVDFVCAVGFGPARESGEVKSGRPGVVISNLGVFDFDEQSGRMRLQSLNAGVTLDQVKENTGFDLLLPSTVPQTDAPTQTEIALIRDRIDPLGLRFLDRMPRPEAAAFLDQHAAREREMFSSRL